MQNSPQNKKIFEKKILLWLKSGLQNLPQNKKYLKKDFFVLYRSLESVRVQRLAEKLDQKNAFTFFVMRG